MHGKAKLWLIECSLLRECWQKKKNYFLHLFPSQHRHRRGRVFNIFSSFFTMAMMTSLFLSNCDVTTSIRVEHIVSPSKKLNPTSQSGQNYFSHLFKKYFIFPTSQGRAFHTLSNNILLLQPVGAEILFHTFSKNILFSQPAKADLSTPSQTIFYSSS